MPQRPQFAVSVDRLVQNWLPSARVQAEVGGLQLHAPDEQVWPTPQARLQKPQLRPSVSGFTQMPLQRIWPVGHGFTVQKPTVHC